MLLRTRADGPQRCLPRFFPFSVSETVQVWGEIIYPSEANRGSAELGVSAEVQGSDAVRIRVLHAQLTGTGLTSQPARSFAYGLPHSPVSGLHSPQRPGRARRIVDPSRVDDLLRI